MKKRSGPEFRQQITPLGTCTECRDGVVLGVFYEMPCSHCHGSGLVDRETGEGLPIEDLVVQLGIRWRSERKLVDRLRAELADRRNAIHREERGHGPMGRRYHGD